MVLDTLRIGFSRAVKWTVIFNSLFLGEKESVLSFHHAKFIEILNIKMCFISSNDGDIIFQKMFLLSCIKVGLFI